MSKYNFSSIFIANEQARGNNAMGKSPKTILGKELERNQL